MSDLKKQTESTLLNECIGVGAKKECVVRDNEVKKKKVKKKEKKKKERKEEERKRMKRRLKRKTVKVKGEVSGKKGVYGICMAVIPNG